jgi:hypothetical protein
MNTVRNNNNFGIFTKALSRFNRQDSNFLYYTSMESGFGKLFWTAKAYASTAKVKRPTRVGNQRNSLISQKNSTKGAKTPTSGFIGETNLSLLAGLLVKDLPFNLEELNEMISQTIRAHDNLIDNHGVAEGTRKWKAITLYCTGMLEGRNPDNPGWVATGSVNRWPKVLRHLLPLYIIVKDNVLIDPEVPNHRIKTIMQFLQTLFKLNKVCSAHADITSHLSDIKSKFRLDPAMVARFERYVREELAEERESITLTDLAIDLFLGPSNGPNGRPKLETALAEASVIRRDPVMYRAVKEICEITNNNDFFKFFEDSSKTYRGADSLLSKIKIRKLVAVPDAGNKSRAVAICDFWTQSILEPLENDVNRVTTKLFSANCCFYSHRQGWDTIMSLPREIQDRLVSLDATAWTDNLPASLQYIVVKALYGQKYADAWKALAVTCPWWIPGFARPIFYGKGQGMGTKGSFAIAQLTDLLFLKFSLRELYPNANPFFMKVGDDLVLEDEMHLMHGVYEQIGVPINLTKSKFKTRFGSFSEFVSRNMWNGLDYSIISPKLLSRFLRDDHYLQPLSDHLKERVEDPIYTVDYLIQQKNIYLFQKAKKKSLTENIDLTKYQLDMDRRESKLRKIISIMDLIRDTGDKLLPDSHSFQTSKEELLLLLENLILVTLGELVHKTEIQSGDKGAAEVLRLAEELKGEFAQIPGKTFHKGVKAFFEKVSHRGYPFREIVALRQVLPVLGDIESRYNTGVENISNAKTFSVFTEINIHSFVTNCDFIELLLLIQCKLEDTSLGYKTLGRTAMFDSGKTVEKTVYLYKLLNSIVDKESLILDRRTGTYTTPKGRTVELNPQLIEGYSELFKFDAMLAEIARMRKTEGIDVKLS